MIGYLGNMSDNADYSVGIGDRVDIEENDVVGIGRSVDIDNQFAIAIGSTTVAQNDGAIVLGYNASSTDPNALLPTNNIAIGVNANVQGLNAVAIGNAATAINDNTLVLGGATNSLSVGIGTDAPDALASLDLGDTNKGILFNRLTDAQITTLETSLTTAHKGLALYDATNDVFQVWDGTAWQSATNTDAQELSLNGSNLGITNSMNTVDLSPLTTDLETRVTALENRTVSSTGDMTPLLFNYQSVIRDTDGNPIKNDAVDVRIAVREDGVTGTIVYNEEHSLTSSEYGVLSLQVGGGTLITGDMATITWGDHEYYLEVSLDAAQSGTFTSLSTTQLLSVPYALHARSADFITGSSGTTSGMRAAKSVENLEIQELKNQVKALQAQMQELISSKK
jgi:hypothetical protein